jgi:hypothetical protein
MAKGHTLGLTAAEGLENENRVQLLEIIDQLRELGISENVSLPQVSMSLTLCVTFSDHIARRRWGSIQRKVIPPRRAHGPFLSYR